MTSIPLASKPVKQCCVNTVTPGSYYQAGSSDGVTWYDVTKTVNGDLHCSCPARGECYHMGNVRSVMAAEATDSWQLWADKINAKAVAAGLVSAERVAVEREAALIARRIRDKSELSSERTLGNGVKYLDLGDY